MNRQQQRTRNVRRQSVSLNCPRHQTGHGRNPSTNLDRQRNVRVISSSCPSRRQFNSRFESESFRPMSSFDPATVRQAVAEFTPRRPQKFQDLFPAKEVIAELRQKRASYRAISEFLTQHCLPTSKTAIATFCHQILGEIVRPHRRAGRKRPPTPAEPNGRVIPSSQELPADSTGGESSPTRSRGPRIAQVRMLKPEST